MKVYFSFIVLLRRARMKVYFSFFGLLRRARTKMYFSLIDLLRRARTKMYFSFKRVAKIHPFSDIYGYGKRITLARVPLFYTRMRDTTKAASVILTACKSRELVSLMPNRVEYLTYALGGIGSIGCAEMWETTSSVA